MQYTVCPNTWYLVTLVTLATKLWTWTGADWDLVTQVTLDTLVTLVTLVTLGPRATVVVRIVFDEMKHEQG